jgi:hypothetical protein
MTLRRPMRKTFQFTDLSETLGEAELPRQDSCHEVGNAGRWGTPSASLRNRRAVYPSQKPFSAGTRPVATVHLL